MVHFLFALLSCLDLGTYGKVFPIQKENLVAEFHKQGKKRWNRVIKKANRFRVFEFDPSMYLTQEVRDHHGNVLYTKGKRVNLLDITSLSEDLLFFDGNDPYQITWAKQQRGMWILTNGKALDLEKAEKRPVFFDHAGYLANKLGIVQIPSKVSQKGKKLIIEEVPCTHESLNEAIINLQIG